VAAAASANLSYTTFETGQVRPLALSPDGSLLYAVNTPDARLEIFAIAGGRRGITRIASVPVGLEPVAVAVRSAAEVWVVNHLSDSISIVDVSELSTARVVQTLLVGDEPSDIVFAGPLRNRAFITTAHRGQNSPVDPQLTTPGVGRADVWVFDATNPGQTLGGQPLTIVTLFCDTPRALAVTPDGLTVYAAAFHSGNRTTTVSAGSIPTNGLPPPLTNFQGLPAPPVGLIVKYRLSPTDGQMHWQDELNRSWDSAVNLSLPDKDVFAIDASANPPVQSSAPNSVYTGVGTVLFNMVVNPVDGAVYVSNTDAQNDQRFEGPGTYAGHSLRGHLAESHVTVLSGAQVLPRHLNKHIDYSHCCDPTPNAESVKSLAFPTDMAVSSDGKTLYVAALGSSKVGVFATSDMENDTFVPNVANQIAVSGGGPVGLALDEARNLLFVLTHFDDSISIVDLASRKEVAHVPMPNPEPAVVVNGRPFLYDAASTSSHGDSACASCHIFGDFDGLAWDLGDPDDAPLNDPGPFELVVGPPQPFHPMKGPMTTLSLRGMDNHGPMHWRGDRTGGNDAPSAQPNSGSFDEAAGFMKFNPAFQDLLGSNSQLSTADMQAFANFVLQVSYPPNPIRNLDNSLTADQQAGHDFFMGTTNHGLPVDTAKTCNGCHVLDATGNSQFGVAHPGFFGTDGQSSFENETQLFKIPHLRNLYQKVGMFGMSPDSHFPADPPAFMGDQVRGFGFLHDGSVDTLFSFHGAAVFDQSLTNPGGIPGGTAGATIRRQLEAFMLVFDNNLAPIVGQQITLTQTNAAVAGPRIDLLEARAAASECDLIAKGRVNGQAVGFLYSPQQNTFSEFGTSLNLSDTALRGLVNVAGGELTFTCVPPGSGARMAGEPVLGRPQRPR
jgi:sugar lactone lactonase YvrE